MRALTIACALLVGTAAARAERTMMDGDAAFAAALHGQLRGKTGNLFYSPVSVRVALAMAMAGARGTTEAELARALSLPAGAEGARAVAAQLADWDRLAHPRTPSTPPAHAKDRVVLRVVSRVWAQTKHKFLDDFRRTLRDLYRAPLGTVDFSHDTEAARRTINHWVADATEHRIRELIGDGALAADTKMVLTDAVYFNGGWRDTFDARSTSPGSFFLGDGKTTTVPLMHRRDHEKLARVDGALVLELPYADGRMVMDVVLPAAKDGLGAIEEAYSKGALVGWLNALAVAEVDITLPKLKLSSVLELVPALQRLGVVHASSRLDADFSGMDGARDLYIGAVIHQAVVDVDEHSTEAAAATASEEVDGALAPDFNKPPPPPIIFRADHPFLFVIRDTTAGVVLFAGRAVDPSTR